MNLTGFFTLTYKELLRFSKVFLQTVFAPVVTALLYLLIFSHVLKDHVQVFDGVSYGSFLIPGLIMMSIIQNAFANSSSSLIQSKVTGNIVFALLAPLSYLEFYFAFVVASMIRALSVGLGIYLVAQFFVDLPIHNGLFVVLAAVLSSMVLGSLGIIAGIWSEKYDHLAGFQNFIIVPLSFLSGVFYSIHSLPEFWQYLSHYNPFFYMIDAFRWGFFGASDVNPYFSLAMIFLAWLGLGGITLWMLKTGYKLRD